MGKSTNIFVTAKMFFKLETHCKIPRTRRLYREKPVGYVDILISLPIVVFIYIYIVLNERNWLYIHRVNKCQYAKRNINV